MVDYTKDVMRDETWRRWKGGDKLAEELKNFYTSKRVFDRLGQQVPLGPTVAPGATAPSAKQKFQQQFWSRMMRPNQGAMRLSAGGRKLIGGMLSGTTAGEDKERAAARQSGATLR